MTGLCGRIALVTGASRGIGKAIARRLFRERVLKIPSRRMARKVVGTHA